MEIYHVNLSDEGTYLCQISHRRLSRSASIHLHIQIPMLLLPAYVYVSPGTNVKLNCSIFLDNSTIKNPVEWHFLSNERNQTRPEHIHIEEEFVNHSLISYLIIQHAQISHSGLWSCKYKRQRRTAKLIVDRDIQRMNALLANQSNRLFSSFLFCLFFVNIVFLSQ